MQDSGGEWGDEFDGRTGLAVACSCLMLTVVVGVVVVVGVAVVGVVVVGVV